MENENKEREQEVLSPSPDDAVSSEGEAEENIETTAATVEEKPPHIVVHRPQEAGEIKPQEPMSAPILKKEKMPKNKWKITSIALGAALVAILVIFGAVLGGKSNTITDLTKDNQKMETKVKKLSEKVEAAAPWFEMTEAQQQEAVEQKEAKEAETAAAAAAAKDEEEKVGYDTGITYDQLARTPDDYNGQKVKFSGKVLQVTDNTDEIDIRLAVNGDYDTVILCGYDPSIVSSRVLEDDEITIYGVSYGLYTYESTMGANITVPLVYIDKIDQ